MGTVIIRVLAAGGIAYQKNDENMRRFFRIITWSDEPRTQNIYFKESQNITNSIYFNLNTDDVYIDGTLLTGTYEEKVAFLETNVFFFQTVATPMSPIRCYLILLV